MDDILVRVLNNSLVSLTLNRIGRRSKLQQRRQQLLHQQAQAIAGGQQTLQQQHGLAAQLAALDLQAALHQQQAQQQQPNHNANQGNGNNDNAAGAPNTQHQSVPYRSDEPQAIGVDHSGRTEVFNAEAFAISGQYHHHSHSVSGHDLHSISAAHQPTASHDAHSSSTAGAERDNFNFGRSSSFRALTSALAINKSLTSLTLGHNHLDNPATTSLANVLLHNTSITHLALPVNKIGVDGARALADVLKVNSTLESLDLTGNCLLDDGAVALADALTLNHTLTTLDLTNCYIYVAGARAIVRALALNNTLTSLMFAKNYALQEAASTLSEALQVNRTLTRLDFTQNMLYADGARELAKGLSNSITEGNRMFSGSLFGSHSDSQPLRRQSTGGTSTTSNSNVVGFLQGSCLKELHLATNEIGNTGLKYLCQALKSNNVLQTLVLHDNLITHDGIAFIATALSKSVHINNAPSLTLLHLCGNSIGSKGAEVLAKAMTKNKTLTRLHLAANDIGNSGIKALCKALTLNTTLVELNLSWNRFGSAGPDGSRYIGAMLAGNSTLRDLQLAHNKLLDEGCEHIAHGLATNRGLYHIDMSSNRIKSKGIETLAAVLTTNTTLLLCNYNQGSQPAHNQPLAAAPAQPVNHQPHAGHQAQLPVPAAAQVNGHHHDNGGPAAAAAAALGGMAANQHHHHLHHQHPPQQPPAHNIVALLQAAFGGALPPALHTQLQVNANAPPTPPNQPAANGVHHALPPAHAAQLQALAQNGVPVVNQEQLVAMMNELQIQQQPPAHIQPPAQPGQQQQQLPPLLTTAPIQGWSSAADHAIASVLSRNSTYAIKKNKEAVLMAFHSRLGHESPLFRVFRASPIGDLSTLRELFSFLYGAEEKQSRHTQHGTRSAHSAVQTQSIYHIYGSDAHTNNLDDAFGLRGMH